MRIALIGLDSFYFTRSLINILHSTPECTLVACCLTGYEDETAQNTGMSVRELQEQSNVPVFASVRSMLDSIAVDAVCVATRPSRVMQVLHVLTECSLPSYVVKPAIAPDGDIESLAGVVESYPGILVSGPTGRLHPSIAQARRRVLADEIGKPVVLRVTHQHGCLSSWPKSSWYFALGEAPPTFTLGWYCVDLLSWFNQGTVSEFQSVAGNLIDHSSPHVDFVKSVCSFTDGAIGSLEIQFGISWQYPSFDIEVIGERGAIRIRSPVCEGGLYVPTGIVGFGFQEGESLRSEISQWLRAVRGDEPPFISRREIITNLKMCKKLHDSLNA